MCPAYWWVAAPLATLASAVGLLYVHSGYPAHELFEIWVPWLGVMLVLGAALFTTFWYACRTRSLFIHWGATGTLLVLGVLGASTAFQGGDSLSSGLLGIQAFFCFVYFITLIGIDLQGRTFDFPQRSLPSAAGQPSKARKWWKLCWVVVLIALTAGLVRTFVAEAFQVTASYVEPELPCGSRILVWKLSSTFAPGDIVAYHHDEKWTFVGRVASVNGDEIRINRNHQPEEVVERRRVIGKVFSVYWRPSIAEPTSGAHCTPSA